MTIMTALDPLKLLVYLAEMTARVSSIVTLALYCSRPKGMRHAY